MTNEKDKLMNRLSIANFAMADAQLYLDTHPTDQAALDYFARYKKLRDQTLAEYNTRFGPMTADQVDSTERWTWIDNPWPWENPQEGEM